MADENFYSSLAAGVSDGSDSDADPTILAKSLGGLDDLDNDIFGSLNSKKKPVAKQPALKKTPATSSSASKEVKKSSFNIDDIMGGDDDDLDTLLSGRPKTTDDTKKSSASSDLFGEAKQRPATTGQSRKPAKKVEFGEFDPDDPLGDLDLSDDDDFGLKKKPTPAKSAPSKARPVTRSGNRPDDSAQNQFPVKTRGKLNKQSDAADDGSDWDASSASSTSKKESEKPAQPAPQAQPSQSQAKPKKKETITFSDDEGDLDLGLDDTPPAKVKAAEKSDGGLKDSLFGKSSSVEKHLQRPGTGDSQREFNISVRASIAESNKSSKKISDEDDDIFGSYAPSVMSSRPGTGRSVRFEDEEPTQKRPATADAAFTAADDDWLGLGVGSSKEKKRPLGLSSTVDFSGTRSQSSSDDWLDMATGSSSRPKTAPVATEKKPPRSPEKKPMIGGSKIGGGDDWLAELSAKVDEDTDFTSRHKPGRRLSTDKTTSRQSSVESTGNTSRRPSLVKQSSADDWLGLGAEAPIEPPAKPMSQTPAGSRPASKSTVKPSPVIDDSDWLGLGSSTPTKDDEAEDWIKAAKLKRQQSADNSLLDPGASRASGTFSLTTEKPATQEVTSFPWEKGGSSTPPKANLSVTGPQTIPSQTLSAAHSIPTSSQPVFQPMFTSLPVPPQPTVNLDSASWNREQESLVKQHQVQLEQMQSQFNQMMEARRQQQQSALHQQMKLAEEAFKLQQQQLQSSISGLGPSAVFPSGLSPTKQSEVQLNNVELESQVKRLEHEKNHLESLIDTMKRRHQEEIISLETSNKAKVLLVEESYQRREFRLREEIEQISADNLSKLRNLEDEKSSLIASNYRRIDEVEKSKSAEISRMREQHHQEIERMKQDHFTAIEVLRKTKEHELEGLLTTANNPQSLQFLMEQMKQNAAGLTAMQFSIDKSHKLTLDERELAMNTRDQQLKVLQECLLKQQEENDKERSRLQELLAKMEIQIREQERQLHQEKWSVSQEKSKLSALQMSVEQERTLLTDQLTRERAELGRAKDSFLAEQRSAMVQLADERRLLAEERTQLTISQRIAAEKGNEESLRQSQGSARYEGLLKTLESEREDLSKRSQAIAVEETKLASERSSLDQEREYLHKEQERLSELAKKIQTEMGSIDVFSKECTQKEVEGKQALAEARRQDSINQSRLNDISVRLEELKVGEKRFAEERLQLHSERKQLESLKSRQLCAGCKQPVSRNPYFSLSTPLMQTRPSPSSLVGIVAPQKLDLTNPTLLQYKIQADQDSDFLNEESAYLDALKYSSYHNNSVSQI